MTSVRQIVVQRHQIGVQRPIRYRITTDDKQKRSKSHPKYWKRKMVMMKDNDTPMILHRRSRYWHSRKVASSRVLGSTVYHQAEYSVIQAGSQLVDSESLRKSRLKKASGNKSLEEMKGENIRGTYMYTRFCRGKALRKRGRAAVHFLRQRRLRFKENPTIIWKKNDGCHQE